MNDDDWGNDDYDDNDDDDLLGVDCFFLHTFRYLEHRWCDRVWCDFMSLCEWVTGWSATIRFMFGFAIMCIDTVRELVVFNQKRTHNTARVPVVHALFEYLTYFKINLAALVVNEKIKEL